MGKEIILFPDYIAKLRVNISLVSISENGLEFSGNVITHNL